MGHTTRTPDHTHVPDLTQLVVDEETDGEAPCAICGALLVAEGPYSYEEGAFILRDGKRLLTLKEATRMPLARPYRDRSTWIRMVVALLNFAHPTDDDGPDRRPVDPLENTQVHP